MNKNFILKVIIILFLLLPKEIWSSECLSTSVADLEPLGVKLNYREVEDDLIPIAFNVPMMIEGLRFDAVHLALKKEQKTQLHMPLKGYVAPHDGSTTFEIEVAKELLNRSILKLRYSEGEKVEYICICLFNPFK